jgi:hypothetical protein
MYTIPSVSHSLHCSQDSCTDLQRTFCQFLSTVERHVLYNYHETHTDGQYLIHGTIIKKSTAIRTAGNSHSQTGNLKGSIKYSFTKQGIASIKPRG